MRLQFLGGPTSSLGNIDMSTDFSGFIIYWVLADDRTGYSVSGVGDVNRDGYRYDDMIIGAFGCSNNKRIYFLQRENIQYVI